MSAKPIQKGFLNRLFKNRKFTVPFSIVFAVVFWLVITLSQNPQRDVTLSGIAVSIVTSNTMVEELGLDVIGDTDTTVSVLVSGPTYIVSGLSANDLSVSANLSEVNAAGTYEIPLVANKVGGKSEYNIISVIPNKMSLTFDYINETEFAVQAIANGAAAVEGLIVDTPVVTNSEDATLTVRGPASYIEKIAAVQAVADVNETLSETASYDADIVLVDADGNKIDDKLFTLETKKVKISVPIYRQKWVKITPVFNNMPAGFGGKPLPYTLSENEIEIKGPPETVDQLTDIKLVPIDFFDISTEKTSFTVAPALPNGIKSVNSNIETVTVKINLAGYRMRIFTVSECRALSLEKGVKVASMGSIRNVKIMGSSAVVRRLTNGQLYAEVDLSGKSAGQYTVTVTIKAASSNQIWQVGTYTTVIVLQ